MKIELYDKDRAAKHWVGGFNAIPTRFLRERLEFVDTMEFVETPFEEHSSKIIMLGSPEVFCENCGEPIEENEKQCECGSTDFNFEIGFPSWGTMWMFSDSLDKKWARENIETLKNCGFLVYEHDDLGIIIGIDGSGYDFYEQHWIPLYEARGLHWHE